MITNMDIQDLNKSLLNIDNSQYLLKMLINIKLFIVNNCKILQ